MVYEKARQEALRGAALAGQEERDAHVPEADDWRRRRVHLRTRHPARPAHESDPCLRWVNRFPDLCTVLVSMQAFVRINASHCRLGTDSPLPLPLISSDHFGRLRCP